MIHTKETKSKISKSRKGENNPFYGKKHTPETRAKLSANLKKYNQNRTYDLKDISIKIPDINDLHYLAGMIDADGSIRFSKGRPFVAVYNSNNELMNWIINKVGGTISGKDKRGREISYTWRVGATRNVYLLCVALMPILKVKKNDADIVIKHLIEKYGKRI